MSHSSMTLWQQLRDHNLVQGDMPVVDHGESAWYIRVMQGFAGWLASVFLLGFFGVAFVWIFENDNMIFLTAIGLGLCTGAYTLFRQQKSNDFLDQLGLAFSLCGQLMVAFAIFQGLDNSTLSLFSLAAFQASLAFIMPNYIHRVASTWFAAIAFFWGLNRIGIYGLAPIVISVLFTVLWLNDYRWGNKRNLFEPIAFGLAISMVHFNGQILFGDDLMHYHQTNVPTWWMTAVPWVTTALTAINFLYLVVFILNKRHIALDSSNGVKALMGGTALMLTGLPIVGASGALIILLVGFHCQRKTLMALGVIVLVSFFSYYYYNLDISLLHKSLILMGAGVVLFFARLIISEKATKQNEAKSLLSGFNFSWFKWVVVATFTVSLLAVNATIYSHETVLDEGRSVLLRLAPVDPRSIMQGDYMRLRFAIVNESFSQSYDQYPSDGHIVVNVDENNVGSFDSIYQEQALEESQVKMQYRIRNKKIKFATNAFFFEEGTGPIFDKARYGEFKVSNDGTLLLHTMRDAQYEVLGINQTN